MRSGASRISPVVGDIKEMGIPTIRNIMTTMRYLSMFCDIYKTIYLLIGCQGLRTMSKILDVVGLVLIAVMILAFVGVIPEQEAGLSPLFWICAVGALGIIFYRKMKKKQESKV